MKKKNLLFLRTKNEQLKLSLILMSKILIEPHYLPCIEYFTLLFQSEEITLEVKENFIKQTYRNRAFILGANGIERLTIPLIKANSKKSFDKVEIDYKENWQNKHWRAIQSAYGKSPFFEFYEEDFKDAIFTPFKHLNELNTNILVICLKHLGLNQKLKENKVYEPSVKNDLSDLRNIVKNKGVKNQIQLKSYIQVFGNNFIPNLSILDLLFCEGPNSGSLIKSQAEKNKDLLVSFFNR